MLDRGDLSDASRDVDLRVGAAPALGDDEPADLGVQVVQLLLGPRVVDLVLADGGGLRGRVGRLLGITLGLVEDGHRCASRFVVVGGGGRLLGPQRQTLVPIREAGLTQRGRNR